MDVLTSLAELEAKIAECNATLTDESDDAMRQLFNTFRMDFSADAPDDPFGAAYRAFQLALYRTVVGRDYEVQNERSHFDIVGKAACPFPYYLKSTSTAGHYLLAIGFMLCKLDLPPGARLLEFGAGWGNTTMELARLGFDVTVVDIEPNFLEVIRLRAMQAGVAVRTIEADFFWAETIERPFDAVLFFESFHHCDDHARLLRALQGAVVPGGSVYLASEPIIEDYPVPWGVRMDGEALWAARNFGWLELGFSAAYFQQAAARAGWQATRHHCATVQWASVWQLERAGGATPAEPVTVAVPMAVADPGARARGELAAVYRSTSWRITRPLRMIKRVFSSL